MRIGIHTYFLRTGRIGGSETYTRGLIAALGQVDHENEYILFVRGENQGIFDPLPSNFAEIVIGRRAGAVVRRAGLDLLHYPGTTMQDGSGGAPVVITVHDLQHLYWPRFFSWRERLRRWRQDRPAINRAAAIIAISDFTHRSIREHFPAAAGRVATIYSGVDPAFSRPVAAAEQRRLRARYDLPPTFALYPARPWPHKNHRRLLAAMDLLRRRGVDCPLVLTGFTAAEQPAGWPLPPAGSVRLLGHIPPADLPALYQMAALLVYPSLFEGFGLPLLEAMAAGCPVVCANVTALPEVAGDAALLVDPADSEALAAAMQTLLEDGRRRQALIARGRARAAEFSWEQTARATRALYLQQGRPESQ